MLFMLPQLAVENFAESQLKFPLIHQPLSGTRLVKLQVESHLKNEEWNFHLALWKLNEAKAPKFQIPNLQKVNGEWGQEWGVSVLRVRKVKCHKHLGFRELSGRASHMAQAVHNLLPRQNSQQTEGTFFNFFPSRSCLFAVGLDSSVFSVFVLPLLCFFLKFITSNFLWSQVKDFPIEADKFNVEIRKCISDTHAHWRNSSNYQATKKWIKSRLRKVRGGTSPGNMKLFTFLRGSLRV